MITRVDNRDSAIVSVLSTLDDNKYMHCHLKFVDILILKHFELLIIERHDI